jgi:RHS repeat-associated protein
MMPCHSCSSALDHRLVGDPVDTLTGAVFDRTLDFRLTGPLELWWYRHYDGSQNQKRLALGWGHTHGFDRVLRFNGEGITYVAPVGLEYDFPRLEHDGDEIARHGFLLRRLSARLYQLVQHGEPAVEFELRQPEKPARLRRLFKGRRQILFEYDAAARLERIIDSTGRNILVVEEADGRLISLTLADTKDEPGRLLVAYQYDQRGNLIATETGSGHGYAFTYDDTNRMLTRRGRKGHKSRFEYDGLGRCIKTTADDDLYGVTLAYKVPRRLTKIKRTDQGEWTYHFDPAGNLAMIVDPLGGVQKFVHDETGRLVLELDPNGNPTRYVYDATGALVAKVNPLGHRIPEPKDQNAPNPFGHRVAANPAEYEYGRLVDIRKITLPSQEQARGLPWSWEPRSLISARPRPEQNPGVASAFDVRPLGFLWWPEPKDGRIFNDLGQLVQQRDLFGRLRQWFYDACGNAADYIDFDQAKWSFDYGAWSLLRGITNPLGAEVRFTYTTNGQLASCVDSRGTRSEYRYNLTDHLVEIKRHGVVCDIYVRDKVGNLVAKLAGDGRELLRCEIGPGNLLMKRALASGDEHSFQYDKSGRPLEARTKKDSVEFAYDDMGNRVLEKRNGLGVEHLYQGWRKPLESVLFERFIVRYEWSNENTLVITDPGGKSHEIRFLNHGLIERRFGNRSREASQYDDLGRCLCKCAERRNGEVWKRRYHWSGEGELLRIEENLYGEIRHEYDAAHRLCRRILPDRHAENYELDAADNLLSQPGSAVNLQPGNRLHSVNGLLVEYNDRNHLAVQRTPNDSKRYIYDSRDQMVAVEMTRGRWEADYDALGRRIRMIWDGRTTEYYWNSDQLIAELQSDGRLRLYIYPDPLAMTPLLFLDYDSIKAPVESCKRNFVFSDQIGTPCLVEDESGKETWRARIAPFGHARVLPGAEIELNLRFPGHYYDAELDLHYNRFRFYDPVAARYLQSDPWGIAGGYNLYSYCANPLLKVDIRGLGEGGKKGANEPEEDKPDEEPASTAKPTEEEARQQVQALLDSKAAWIADPKNNPDFKPGVIADLNKIAQTNTGAALLGSISDNHENDPNATVAIVPLKQGENPYAKADGNPYVDPATGDPGNPSPTRVGYTPGQNGAAGQGTSQSPSDAALAHELAHADSNGQGQNQSAVPVQPGPVANCPNAEEQKAVNTENAYRGDQGLDQRNDYQTLP